MRLTYIVLAFTSLNAFADFQVIKDGVSYQCIQGGGKVYAYTGDHCGASTIIDDGFQITGDSKIDYASCRTYLYSVLSIRTGWYMKKNGNCIYVTDQYSFCDEL